MSTSLLCYCSLLMRCFRHQREGLLQAPGEALSRVSSQPLLHLFGLTEEGLHMQIIVEFAVDSLHSSPIELSPDP